MEHKKTNHEDGNKNPSEQSPQTKPETVVTPPAHPNQEDAPVKTGEKSDKTA